MSDPTDAEVERIARVICQEEEGNPDGIDVAYPPATRLWQRHKKTARAVLAALPSRAEIERAALRKAMGAMCYYCRDGLPLNGLMHQGANDGREFAVACRAAPILALIPQEPQS